MLKTLIGIDPSYSRTGISIYNNEKIWVTEVKAKDILGNKPLGKSFEDIYKESELLSKAIYAEIMRVLSMIEPIGDIEVLSECPPPQGSYAPGLYALDIRLFTLLCTRNWWKVYRVYPNYLMHIHGKRDYQKSESVELAKFILDRYDYRILSKRLSHDESESIIFLSRLMYKAGYLKKDIVDRMPNVKNEKEAKFG